MSAETLVPSYEDAERAARVLVEEHGVGSVVLFGSVANGTAREGSDIDMVAVYDDLDYRFRYERSRELAAAARAHAGCEVDVRVTDRPEWKHRTEVVRNSFESGIADSAVVLVDHPPGEVNWDKEIGMPDSEQREIDRRLNDIRKELEEINSRYVATPEEVELPSTDLLWSLRRQDRLIAVCAHGAMVVEHGLKALLAMYSVPPPRTHSATELLDIIDQRLDNVRLEIPRSMLRQIGTWRQAGTYGETFYEMNISIEELKELAAQYSAISISITRQVVKEYSQRYTTPGKYVDPLIYTCEKLEKTRTERDLLSGSVTATRKRLRLPRRSTSCMALATGREASVSSSSTSTIFGSDAGSGGGVNSGGGRASGMPRHYQGGRALPSLIALRIYVM